MPRISDLRLVRPHKVAFYVYEIPQTWIPPSRGTTILQQFPRTEKWSLSLTMQDQGFSKPVVDEHPKD